MIKVWLDGVHDGITNMARDRELLNGLHESHCLARVYGWDEAWVTLGHFQNSDQALLPHAPVKSVIRPTGGKAVLHGHDITLGIAARLDWLGVSERKIVQVYRAIVKPVVEALNECGVSCSLGEETRFVRSQGNLADCFAHVSPNDIVQKETGYKVCGCALRVIENAVLVQASIPVDKPIVDPYLVFAKPATTYYSKNLKKDEFAEALEVSLVEFKIHA